MMTKKQLIERKLKTMIRRIMTEERFERFNIEYLIDKQPISKEFNTPEYKIVKAAYNDEGNNAYILFDKKNKKIVSYSLSGTSQFQKWKELV
jgi:hypothetical protein